MGTINIKEEAKDAFNVLTDDMIRVGIREIVAAYNWRNGKKNHDGSMGTVRISPKELRDLLAFMSQPDAEEKPIDYTNVSN